MPLRGLKRCHLHLLCHIAAQIHSDVAMRIICITEMVTCCFCWSTAIWSFACGVPNTECVFTKWPWKPVFYYKLKAAEKPWSWTPELHVLWVRSHVSGTDAEGSGHYGYWGVCGEDTSWAFAIWDNQNPPLGVHLWFQQLMEESVSLLCNSLCDFIWIQGRSHTAFRPCMEGTFLIERRVQAAMLIVI